MPLVRPGVRPCLLLAVACLGLGFATRVDAQTNMAQVNAAVADMKSGDREKVTAARATLLSNLNAVRQTPALSTYSHDIGTLLMPVAQGNDPHAKLNAAIVVQRVAEQGGSADLAPITTTLIGDNSSAVASYGLRAAAYILPRMMAAQKTDTPNPLVPAIVAAVNKHPESEAVAAEAYNAIVSLLLDRNAATVLTPAGVDTASKHAVEALHALLTARVSRYGSGTVAEPAADLQAVNFLGRTGAFNASTSEQRIRTLRLLLQLMDGAVNEMAKVPPSESTSRLRLQDLRQIVKSAGQSLSVITDPGLLNKPDLKAAADKQKPLSQASPVAAYRTYVTDVMNAFYAALPETRPNGQSTTAPTTAPAAASGAASGANGATGATGAGAAAPAGR